MSAHSEMILVVSLLSLFGAFASYLVIQLPTRYWLKWLLIPATLGLALFLTQAIPDLMGRAYQGLPRGDFLYLDHEVVTDRNGDGTATGKHIELWVGQRDGTRLYTIPFDPGLARKLDIAKAAAARGTPMKGQFRKGNPGMEGVEMDVQLDSMVAMKTILPPKPDGGSTDQPAVGAPAGALPGAAGPLGPPPIIGTAPRQELVDPLPH